MVAFGARKWHANFRGLNQNGVQISTGFWKDKELWDLPVTKWWLAVVGDLVKPRFLGEKIGSTASRRVERRCFGSYSAEHRETRVKTLSYART